MEIARERNASDAAFERVVGASRAFMRSWRFPRSLVRRIDHLYEYLYRRRHGVAEAALLQALCPSASAPTVIACSQLVTACS